MEGWILQHFLEIIDRGEVPSYIKLMSRASVFSPRKGNQVTDPYRHALDRMTAEDIRYDSYTEYREAIPFDEISLYTGWLAASSTIILDEVFVDWEHHMVHEEARATITEHEWSYVEGYISWYYRVSHPYMLPATDGDPPRPAHEEILRTHQAELDHT
ncbi:uncharacterized protein LOC131638792 [Vicia villosa]|uniref:uncharacterized protein LOC131638792 n=1 Tax=Vicia villosa TaxID=3911 RepID=UPI00273C20BA|nr:uncharacterized protein LOC131638792 [Vicia villosa]